MKNQDTQERLILIHDYNNGEFDNHWIDDAPDRRIRYSDSDMEELLGATYVEFKYELIARAKHSVLAFAMSCGYDILIYTHDVEREQNFVKVLLANRAPLLPYKYTVKIA